MSLNISYSIDNRADDTILRIRVTVTKQLLFTRLFTYISLLVWSPFTESSKPRQRILKTLVGLTQPVSDRARSWRYPPPPPYASCYAKITTMGSTPDSASHIYSPSAVCSTRPVDSCYSSCLSLLACALSFTDSHLHLFAKPFGFKTTPPPNRSLVLPIVSSCLPHLSPKQSYICLPSLWISLFCLFPVNGIRQL